MSETSVSSGHLPSDQMHNTRTDEGDFTEADFKDFVYNIIANDPLGSNCSREQWEEQYPLPYLKSIYPYASSTPIEIPWPDIRNDEKVFTHFPKLPKELRLQIWEYMLPTPRVVGLRKLDLAPPSHDASLGWTAQLETLSTFNGDIYSSLDKVCRESAKVLSNRYHGLETVASAGVLESISLARGIPRTNPWYLTVDHCLDCSRDTLLLTSGFLREITTAGISLDFTKVKHVAIGSDNSTFAAGDLSLDLFMPHFPSLRSFTVVIGPVTRPRQSSWKVGSLVPLNSEFESFRFEPTYHVESRNLFDDLRSAEDIRREFQDVKSVHQDSWATIDFNVSFLAWNEGQDTWYHEKFTLPTVQSEAGKRTCFMERPMAVVQDELLWCFPSHHGNIHITCEKEGYILSRYHGLVDLFQEKTEAQLIEEQNATRDWTRHGGETTIKVRGGETNSWRYFPRR